jgi:hypothetical protein
LDIKKEVFGFTQITDNPDITDDNPNKQFGIRKSGLSVYLD